MALSDGLPPPRRVDPSQGEVLNAIIALADANKATLGYIPWGAWPEFAAKQQLLAVHTDEGRLMGYALFDVAHGRVRLIQLCTDADARGQGISRLLVDEIAKNYRTLRGIVAKCRSEYEANAVWPKLGFTPMNEVPGRSAARTPLTVWFRSNNVPDLFTPDEDDTTLLVALDHNVFLDLCVHRDREGAAESQVLESDWLADQIRLLTTPETLNEINNIPGGRAAERKRQRDAAVTFGQLEVPAVAARQAGEMLRSALGSVSVDEESDLRHVAQAVAAGASVLLTRDQEWIKKGADGAAATLGIRLMRPSDLVVHLDELQNAARYRPAALRGTELSLSSIPSNVEQVLSDLIDMPGGETRIQFRNRLRTTAATPSCERYYVHDVDGKTLSAWALTHRVTDRTTEVSLLRAAAHPFANTVAALVAFGVRRAAVAAASARIVVSDPHIGRDITAILARAGFEATPNGMIAYPLAVTSTSQALELLPPDAALTAIATALLEGRGTAAECAWLEHALHPAKLLDTELPTFVISIRPRWAYDLLGLRPALWDPASLLGASAEHIYYRYRAGNPPAAARIIWYSSSQKGVAVRRAVGCSLLRGVDVGHPDTLFRRYQHLGVYTLDDVRDAGAERVSALRFTDTELFIKPVAYKRMQQLAAAQGSQLGTLQSPTKISSALFETIYKEGGPLWPTVNGQS